MNMRIKVGDSVRRKFPGGGPNNKHFVEGQLYVVADAVPVKGVNFQELSFEGKRPDPNTCFSSHFFEICNPPENQAPLFEPRHFMRVFTRDPNTRFLRTYPFPFGGIPDKVQDEYGGGNYLFQEIRSDANGRSQIVQVTQVAIPAPIPPPDPTLQGFAPVRRPRDRITYNPTPSPGYGPGEVGDYVLEKTVAPVDPKRYGVAQRRIK